MILAIAGMHRSGTSLTAAWLQSGGLVLDNGNPVPPASDNPTGFFEDADFVNLHTGNLLRNSPLSAGWKAAPAHPLTFSTTELQTATAIIAIRQQRFTNWGWKDPRTTLFLPQWKILIPHLKVIIVWRPCTQVVSSLLRRWWKSKTRKHYLDPIWAIRLWKAHNHLACDYKTQFPDDTVVVAASQLPDTWEVIYERLTTQLGLPFAPIPINNLFVPQLLHRQNSGWLQPLCVLLGSGPIEARLQALSVGRN